MDTLILVYKIYLNEVNLDMEVIIKKNYSELSEKAANLTDLIFLIITIINAIH